MTAGIGRQAGRQALSNMMMMYVYTAGDSLLDNFLKIVPEAEVGKILIQR